MLAMRARDDNCRAEKDLRELAAIAAEATRLRRKMWDSGASLFCYPDLVSRTDPTRKCNSCRMRRRLTSRERSHGGHPWNGRNSQQPQNAVARVRTDIQLLKDRVERMDGRLWLAVQTKQERTTGFMLPSPSAAATASAPPRESPNSTPERLIASECPRRLECTACTAPRSGAARRPRTTAVTEIPPWDVMMEATWAIPSGRSAAHPPRTGMALIIAERG